MKITIIGTVFPYRGGLAAFNERLAKEFVEEGENVKVETFTLQYPNFLFPGKTQYSSESSAPNLHISRSVNSINPFNWIRVGKDVSKGNPDVVVFAYWMSFFAPCFGTIAKVIKKKCNAKLIGLIHNMTPHESSIIDKYLPPYFLKCMDGFVALSDFVMNDVEKCIGSIKSKVISPHPIYDIYGSQISREEALEKLSLSKDCTYLLFFGFIRDYKGLDLLLQAMADSRISSKPIKLLVVGEFYGNEEKYKNLETTLKLNNIIWISDYVPDSSIATYFCASDLIVQPYKSATQSGVAQIAYHFEKPLVVTNVGGLPEIVPDGKVGYVVNPNPGEIADAIIRFLENTDKNAFLTNIKEEKKKYQWNILTKKIKEMIANM